MATESCSICKADYEHISTYDNGDKLYKCRGAVRHIMVVSSQKPPKSQLTDEELAEIMCGGGWYGGHLPWQYQWTQQLVLNQISWKPYLKGDYIQGWLRRMRQVKRANIMESLYPYGDKTAELYKD